MWEVDLNGCQIVFFKEESGPTMVIHYTYEEVRKVAEVIEPKEELVELLDLLASSLAKNYPSPFAVNLTDKSAFQTAFAHLREWVG